jgi:PhzF family phenazine biosynthesis protein
MKSINKDAYITIFQVDAFTDRPFHGNPAAVCVLDRALDDVIMQKIAMEMNVSETAFATPAHKSGIVNSDRFGIRWFTPTCETTLCGHATLAAAKVIYDIFENKSETLIFHSKIGDVYVARRGGYLQLDYPAVQPQPTELSDYMADALRLEQSGIIDNFMEACESVNPKMLLLRFRDPNSIKMVTPDFFDLYQLQISLGYEEVIVTARGEDRYDFVSRSFTPSLGIDEDPVSGAAHTLLTPYWCGLLNKKSLIAYQDSKRGGEIIVELKDDPRGFRKRVLLSGKAVIVMEAIINLDPEGLLIFR